MAPRKESEPNVSKKKHFKFLDRKVEKNGMKELKHLEAVLKALLKRQAKLQAKLDRPGERKPTMEQLQRVNDQLARFNAWTQQYIETKLADSAWDASNKGV
ncbi:hypothetical protein QUC31_002594 [Theobroma cacao]